MEQVYHLLYNAGSGGNRGQKFLQLDNLVSISGIEFADESRETGLQLIMKQKADDIHVVMAGGDGSIMWIVELLLQHQVNIHRCIIIPFPFGTGNDFANTLGWGTSVPNDVIGIERVFGPFSILKEDGFISEIRRNENGANEMKLQLNDQRYYKQMINYFSIGVDARIGFGFDKYRTSNQCCNKCVYCWEGFKKMFLNTPKVNQSIENIHHVNDDNLETALISKHNNQIVVPGDPVNLLCLNINSYAGGLKNIWLNAQQNQVKSIPTFLLSLMGSWKYSHSTLFQDQAQKDGFLDRLPDQVKVEDHSNRMNNLEHISKSMANTIPLPIHTQFLLGPVNRCHKGKYVS
ncbi:unnamed protein product (macronuclear) [Paramecium tetraurelia]|uniref:diacylglycerol kinase (ATP) n=1 Tax=Paramecium tetraurelia TaxID=5888 RepID=A0BTD8_PARTE|nr:uncharacterized protein GSPATT00032037001 [Paramecium tetraurelia]CAK61805.1 unnamed protein product [Paramecium tetraurelia]|eukprot:XP_001429203.1 hypothetical protein (macronuclear) [Paramecium tetraurelia strain d4-2]